MAKVHLSEENQHRVHRRFIRVLMAINVTLCQWEALRDSLNLVVEVVPIGKTALMSSP